MKNKYIKKMIIASITSVMILGTLSMGAGASSKGWTKKDNKWYYVTSDGSYKTGWFKDSTGKWYYFDSNGVMQSNTTVTTNGKSYLLGADGAWIQKYGISDKGVESGATYKIINVGSGKALDVYSAEENNYSNVDIYDDNNTYIYGCNV